MDIYYATKIASLLGNVCIFLGLIFAFLQVYWVKKRFRADHERTKKQATIEFYHRVDKVCDELLEQIDDC